MFENEILSIREKVSAETGVPADLLTADTENECKQQAEKILEWKGSMYPEVRDGGEPVSPPPRGKTTRELFAEAMERDAPSANAYFIAKHNTHRLK